MERQPALDDVLGKAVGKRCCKGFVCCNMPCQSLDMMIYRLPSHAKSTKEVAFLSEIEHPFMASCLVSGKNY